MLKIQLSPPYFFKGKYIAFVDFGLRKDFTNKRAAEDYIRLIEAEYNQAVLFINEKFIQLYEFYRIYFIADSDFRFKYEVENCFQLIENRLNYIASNSTSRIQDDRNAFISKAINTCFDTLLQVCKLISKKSVSRYDCLTKNRIALKIRVINNYMNDFQTTVKSISDQDNLKLKAG
jgi:hypothetical protein